ncbi:histidine kinase [Chitinophaga sp. SYP-B3965]|nr:sensor histidine kinase [Chitinophaga sp. SYP-B3965]MRG44702.1 histidine kinase [Chitinophaga sp. SYP-B3965]
MKFKYLLLLFAALFTNVYSKAQQYYFRHYQVENGLSHNTVFSVLQDRQGFLWMGTKDGLNRFDGHVWKVFRHIAEDSTSLPGNFVYALHEDNKGQMWVVNNRGLHKYNAATESFTSSRGTFPEQIRNLHTDTRGNIWYISEGKLYMYDHLHDTTLMYSPKADLNYVNNMHVSAGNLVWMSFYNGCLKKFDPATGELNSYDVYWHSPKTTTKAINVIRATTDDRLLIGTASQGIKLMNIHTGEYEDIVTYNPNNVGVYVRDIIHNKDSEYWIATESGIYIYDLATKKITNLRKQYNNPYSLTDNAVYCLRRDQEGGIWAGTYFGGVNYYPKQYTYFQKYFPDNSDQTISGNAVREICEDKYGNLWVGTEDNGVSKMELSTGKITHYKPGKISHTNVHGLLAIENELWVGTWDNGLDVIDIPTGKLINHFDAGPNTFTNMFVVVIFRTSTGDILVGTGNDLVKYNRASNTFTKVEEVPYSNKRSIAEDKEGNIWVGTSDKGLYYYNPRTGKKGSYNYDEKDSTSLISNSINNVLVDKDQNIWAGTEGEGACRLNRKTQTFTRYTTRDGLPSNYIFRILQDNSGKMWITTSRGLACMDPVTKEIKVFTSINGILNDQFNYSSGYKDKNGKMYIGSVKGMISFNPDEFIKDTFVAPVYITGFNIKNKATTLEDKKAILFTKKIVLPHDQSSFSIDFAALSFTAPETISYAYKMDGLDKEWTHLETNRIVYFTDLKPGKYRFTVTTTDNNNKLGEHPATLEIEVQPPFWATSWAYLLYALLFISGCYYFINRYHHRQNLKHKRKLEELQHKKEKELYQAKVDFLTNVAHEINTPLTLIKGPLEQVIENPEEIIANRNHLQIMERNTNRLVQLTNQLLDFRQTESTGFRLHFSRMNITELLQDTYENFKIPAAQKKLVYQLTVPDQPVFAYADEEGLNKIFSNLFSNAIKYADKLVKIQLKDTEKGMITLEVSNDGNLIPDEMKEKIFAPFVRLENNEKQKGTGIGLSICRSLTTLHKGELYVAERNNGLNTFVLAIPGLTENL